MVNFTLKKLPEQLHQMLKKQAEKNRRSLNSEILACLEQTVQQKGLGSDIERILKNSGAIRQSLSIRLTDKILKKFKSEGRQ